MPRYHLSSLDFPALIYRSGIRRPNFEREGMKYQRDEILALPLKLERCHVGDTRLRAAPSKLLISIFSGKPQPSRAPGFVGALGL